jgi:predicted SnoaL-like aldol condensation-catalyzing enzyme
MCTIFALVKSSILTAAKDDVIDYVENKKIADHWDVIDQLNLMQQIGAILPQVKK